MDIVEQYPPNYSTLESVFDITKDTVFCFGKTIYNPFGKELTADVIYHESVHSRQQGDNPDRWWIEYIKSPEFRLSQEIEAYGEQYAFLKRTLLPEEEKANKEGKTAHVRKFIEDSLENMSFALSGGVYGNLISYGEAVSKIRNHARRVETDR